MKHFALPLLFILSLLSCRDRPGPEPGIEGLWRQMIPVHPPRTYDFRNGVVTQSTTFAGSPVATLQFVYTERGDTLLIGGDLNNPPRTWLLRFIGDGALEAQQVSADPLGLGGYFIFERL